MDRQAVSFNAFGRGFGGLRAIAAAAGAHAGRGRPRLFRQASAHFFSAPGIAVFQRSAFCRASSKASFASATAGVALPVRRSFYTNQFTTVNLAIEAGSRGSKSNAIRENLFRVALGLNLSDIWFNPRKYD